MQDNPTLPQSDKLLHIDKLLQSDKLLIQEHNKEVQLNTTMFLQAKVALHKLMEANQPDHHQ
jgi:hypothetical protein